MIMNQNIPNYELLVLCLGELGGQDIDRENAYHRMFVKSPDQYSWRTREFPDIKKCDASLHSAEHKHKLVEKTSKWGLSLTVKGEQKYNELRTRDNNDDLNIGGRPSIVSDWEGRLFERVRKSDAFINWQKDKYEENAWHDIYDCYSTLKIKANFKTKKLIVYIARLVESSSRFEKYKEVNQFLEQTINNLKRSQL